MRTVRDMVQQEVIYCVSALVSTLAESHMHQRGKLSELIELAVELTMPVDDFEEAAIQAGWKHGEDDGGFWFDGSAFGTWKEACSAADARTFETAEEVCREMDIEPYQREIFEHWIVTDWFADELIKQGEKVEKDFEGLCIWARQTTGQMIDADCVIKRIHAELMSKVNG